MVAFSPTPRTLMGPGPSDVHPRILASMSKPTIGHLDPEFSGLREDIKEKMRSVFLTGNRYTLPLFAPGSGAMESAFVNLVEPGDKVVVCANGVFGMRMAENVRRIGGELVLVEDPWGEPVDPEKLREALKEHPDTKVVSMVHAETSTGVRSDVMELCKIAKSFGCLHWYHSLLLYCEYSHRLHLYHHHPRFCDTRTLPRRERQSSSPNPQRRLRCSYYSLRSTASLDPSLSSTLYSLNISRFATAKSSPNLSPPLEIATDSFPRFPL